MKPKQRIKITIKPDGTAIVQPMGYAGQKCADVTKALEKAVGTVTSTKRTVEWAIKEAEVCKVSQKK